MLVSRLIDALNGQLPEPEEGAPYSEHCIDDEDELPLDPDFATVLLDWKARAPASPLMFSSHITGRYFHASPIQQDYIRPAGCCLVTCPICSAEIGRWCQDESGKRVGPHDKCWEAAGRFGNLGRHSFRHIGPGWMRPGLLWECSRNSCGTVQISTTMNVYGNALMESKRDTNSRVAKLALGQGLYPQLKLRSTEISLKLG